MSMYEYAFQPFADYLFMRRALVACAALAIGGAPLGVFMVLRRMTLVGDAMSHAILPGVAVAYVLFGLTLWPMTLGGLVAGLLVAVSVGAITHLTQLKEDAGFTGTSTLSLAVGVLLLSLHGNAVDLMHVLFGNVLAIDNPSLLLVVAMASISTLTLAIIYRGLILACFDPGFLRSVHGRGGLIHQLFLMLLVLNLVCAFQAIGTMMALGVMILPSIAARFWTRDIDTAILLSIALAIAASYTGLLLSYHYSLPSGPTIVLTAGSLYLLSVLFGRYGSVMSRLFPHKHFAH